MLKCVCFSCLFVLVVALVMSVVRVRVGCFSCLFVLMKCFENFNPDLHPSVGLKMVTFYFAIDFSQLPQGLRFVQCPSFGVFLCCFGETYPIGSKGYGLNKQTNKHRASKHRF